MSLITFTYADTEYVGWDPDDALAAGVPQGTIDAAAALAARVAMQPVSAYQLRSALLAWSGNKLDDVDTYMATASQEQQLWWAHSPYFRRADPIWLEASAFFTAVGLTAAELDTLFTTAAGTAVA
jgi:hypothetical protein